MVMPVQNKGILIIIFGIYPAGRPWSCIFRNWSGFGSYIVYLIDTRISNTSP